MHSKRGQQLSDGREQVAKSDGAQQVARAYFAGILFGRANTMWSRVCSSHLYLSSPLARTNADTYPPPAEPC